MLNFKLLFIPCRVLWNKIISKLIKTKKKKNNATKICIEILYPSHGDLILTLITLCLSFESMLKKPKRSSFIQLKRGSSMTFENKLE